MSIMEQFANKWRKDGVDHILIGGRATTEIGRLAAKDLRREFFIPYLGNFTTPGCFANWIATGDDNARHDFRMRVKAKNTKLFSTCILYAKYYQLASVVASLKRAHIHGIPFVSYKIHDVSGVRELDRWKEYPQLVKEMVEHLIDPKRGVNKPFPWIEEHKEKIWAEVQAIVGEYKADEETPDVDPSKLAQPEQEEIAAEVQAEEPEQEEAPCEETAADDADLGGEFTVNVEDTRA